MISKKIYDSCFMIIALFGMLLLLFGFHFYKQIFFLFLFLFFKSSMVITKKIVLFEDHIESNLKSQKISKILSNLRRWIIIYKILKFVSSTFNFISLIYIVILFLLHMS